MTICVPPAFAAKLIDHLPALRRYASALCGDRVLADDLVQDGIERALTRSETLQQPERLGAWLRSIIHNLYLDELRRRRVRGVPVDVEDMANDLEFSTAANDGGPVADLQRAMRSLTVEHRQVLVLAGVEELSYREISEELGVPLGTVMSRLARARAALRERLDLVPPARPAAPLEQRV